MNFPGKRQQKNTLVSPPTKDATADLVPALLRGGADGSRSDGSPAAADKRISCEVPRSPTLPAEIRRSRPPVGRAAPQPTPPPPTRPTVVARLMGLTAGDAPESAAEKRRELLGALDKCDRDLKALKRIIDVVRSAEQLRHEQGAAKPNASFDGRLQELAKEEEGGGEAEGDGDSGDNENSNSGGEEQQQEPPEQAAEQPSPVSVLDEFTRWTLISGYTKRHSSAGMFSSAAINDRSSFLSCASACCRSGGRQRFINAPPNPMVNFIFIILPKFLRKKNHKNKRGNL